MLIFIGDVHGEFKQLTAKIVRSDVRDSSFIQVGDFGVGFKFFETEINELTVLDRFLQSTNNTLYVIRGNHDKPSYFKGKSDYSNIYFLKDYSVIEAEGKNILLVGGAISIDRAERVMGSSVWRNEGFAFDEGKVRKKLQRLERLDIVVTHNAPSDFEPGQLGETVYHFAEKDKTLIADIEKERKQISELLYFLLSINAKPKCWYYGHFHRSLSMCVLDIRYRLLDCLEFYVHDSHD